MPACPGQCAKSLLRGNLWKRTRFGEHEFFSYIAGSDQVFAYTCSHCGVCGELLWTPGVGDCMVHEGACPDRDFTKTTVFPYLVVRLMRKLYRPLNDSDVALLHDRLLAAWQKRFVEPTSPEKILDTFED